MTLLGVYREKRFSPGKVREDAAILEATLRALSRMGHTFHTLEAEALGRDFNTRGNLSSEHGEPGTRVRVREAPAAGHPHAGGLEGATRAPMIDYPCVLTMAQSAPALEVLDAQLMRGVRIINSIPSVRNTYRKPLIHLLGDGGLRVPQSEIVATEKAEDRVSFRSSASYWLKRGDVHAMESGDVKKVGSPEELAAALCHFKERKIGEVLVQEHVEGDVIKFYGAGTGSYFSAFFASTGDKMTSGTGELRLLASRAAEAIGLEIYGGDAVITPKQDVVLIDVNDWPSFSRCREEAANSIAGYIAGIL